MNGTKIELCISAFFCRVYELEVHVFEAKRTLISHSHKFMPRSFNQWYVFTYMYDGAMRSLSPPYSTQCYDGLIYYTQCFIQRESVALGATPPPPTHHPPES